MSHVESAILSEELPWWSPLTAWHRAIWQFHAPPWGISPPKGEGTPSVAIENDHRNSGFSHEKWWIFPISYVKLPEGNSLRWSNFFTYLHMFSLFISLQSKHAQLHTLHMTHRSWQPSNCNHRVCDQKCEFASPTYSLPAGAQPSRESVCRSQGPTDWLASWPAIHYSFTHPFHLVESRNHCWKSTHTHVLIYVYIYYIYIDRVYDRLYIIVY